MARFSVFQCLLILSLVALYTGKRSGHKHSGTKPEALRTNLTEEEEDYIKDNWELVKKDYLGIGTAVFQKLFTKFPNYQKLFKHSEIGSTPLKKLKESPKFRSLVLGVMYKFEEMIEALDDLEALREILKGVGKLHAQHGVNWQKYEGLGKTMIELFQEKLGDELFPAGAKTAWKKFFKYITRVTKEEGY